MIQYSVDIYVKAHGGVVFPLTKTNLNLGDGDEVVLPPLI